MGLLLSNEQIGNKYKYNARYRIHILYNLSIFELCTLLGIITWLILTSPNSKRWCVR